MDEEIESGEDVRQNKRPHLQQVGGVEREEISDEEEEDGDGDDEEEEEEGHNHRGREADLFL